MLRSNLAIGKAAKQGATTCDCFLRFIGKFVEIHEFLPSESLFLKTFLFELWIAG
ncbi:MAG: hypothetical protein BWY75_01252 [bacterium ADurb.Bin425]|nr:MAG: hypothetical protein BWY75_01252 [bacterium ADurb.Bin425]